MTDLVADIFSGLLDPNFSFDETGCPACAAKVQKWWSYCAMCGWHIAGGQACMEGPKAVCEVAAKVLRREGRPLSRGKLTAALEAEGVKIIGTDKESRSRYVGTILWRHPKRFVHVEKLGYWLADQPTDAK